MQPNPENDRVELALCQVNSLVGDLVGNADKVIAQIAQARQSGAQLVLFPELVLSGYPPEDLVLRQDFLVAARAQLERVASHCTDVVAFVGYPMAHADGVANALAVLAGGEVVMSYRKRLLPNYGVFDEQRYFISGDEDGLVLIGDMLVGISVCEDAWADEPVVSGLARRGARLVVNASASPFHMGKARQREEMLSSRAARHDLPIAYCNLVGGQDELVFDGASSVIAADGQVVARAVQFEEQLLRASLELTPSPARVDQSLPRVAMPAGSAAANTLAPQADSTDLETYGALMLGLRDYVEKNGFPGAIVGLSGGIDSALVLALACDALGSDRVTSVMMPSPYNTAATRSDAEEMVRRLGCPAHELPIAPMMEAFDSALSEVFAGRPPDSTEENIQARIRGTLIMALSNKFGHIVLTTGNKSEMAVGYSTLYGDMAGGFAALKDVPKQHVFRLSRWRNRNVPQGSRCVLPEPIPEAIIERPPSAELRPDQLDSDTLGSYEELDRVIEQYVEQDLGLDEIERAGSDRQFAARILRMIDLAEYKRRQAPPGVKVTERAFGRDRRMPITARRNYG